MLSLFGWAGFSFIQLCGAAQLIGMIKNPRGKTLNWLSLLALITGLSLQLVYAITIRDWVFSIGNTSGIIMWSAQGILKYRRMIT